MSSTPDTFDYIVVGSGAGGGPLAAGLARRGHEVLLVEAGGLPPEDPPEYAIPAFYPAASEDPSFSWAYYVRHFGDPARQGRDFRFHRDGRQGVLYPRAGTLGGCTAHYAMIMVAPHDSDWNAIAAALGDPSWSAAAMRQYLDRVMNRQAAPQELLRQLLSAAGLRPIWLPLILGLAGHGPSGAGGWLPVSRPDVSLALGDPKVVEVVKAALAECAAAGLGVRAGLLSTGLMNWTLDPNDPHDGVATGGEGLLIAPMATDGVRRQGTREYLTATRDASGGRLTIWTDALVTRVDLSSGARPRALGVQLFRGDARARAYQGFRNPAAPPASDEQIAVRARREVILAAGAFNSPQLLMLSGIGPAVDLAADPIQIDVRVDLPGVGQNLQDRYEVAVISELSQPFALLNGVTFEATARDTGFQQWSQQGRGLYTSNGALVAFAKKSRAARQRGGDPDLFVFAAPSYFEGYYDGWAQESLLKPALRAGSHYRQGRPYLTWVILKAHTSARGSVQLSSSSPFDRPLINFNSFDPGDEDREAVVEAIEFVRRINARLGWIRGEVVPGPGAHLGGFVMDNAWGHHASCTCPMGRDPSDGSVVDGEFRVHGVDRLRVVDASVFPSIPGFFIVTPIYMVSEKAVDVIDAAARAGGT